MKTEQHHGMEQSAGVDEAGRGPLAGPVIAAAVILGKSFAVAGLADSKTLSPARRRIMAEAVFDHALSYAIGRAEPHEIDEYNILNATLLAMQRAVAGLIVQPRQVLVDGNQAPDLPIPVETIIKGDQTIPCISAASIIAKVTRDEEMVMLDEQFPGYGFARHKGYPTRQHLSALREMGISPIHRQSFAPVKQYLR